MEINININGQNIKKKFKEAIRLSDHTWLGHTITIILGTIATSIVGGFIWLVIIHPMILAITMILVVVYMLGIVLKEIINDNIRK